MADERSVDVDEGRGDQSTPESGPLISPAGGLSAAQQARAAYVRHAAEECPRCRDIDRDRCSQGNALWRAWEAACDEAFQRLGSEIRST